MHPPPQYIICTCMYVKYLHTAGRVRHMKGLNDIPICYVEDNLHQRFLMSAPSGQDLGPGYRPPGSTRYGARGKLQSAVGIGKILYISRSLHFRINYTCIDYYYPAHMRRGKVIGLSVCPSVHLLSPRKSLDLDI